MNSNPRISNSTDQIRVLSVDDHVLIREGIAALIANQKDMRLVAEASNGGDRKSTRLNSSHEIPSRMPSSA